MCELKRSYELDIRGDVVVSGTVGPRYDGYSPTAEIESADAADYHQPQLATFADAGADRATAYTISHGDLDEAVEPRRRHTRGLRRSAAVPDGAAAAPVDRRWLLRHGRTARRRGLRRSVSGRVLPTAYVTDSMM